MAADALHIWPRGNYMLIALPNSDGSFTATLFLAKHGTLSFAEPDASGRDRSSSCCSNFPDARALMPDCVAEFQAHPTGFLGTVYGRSPGHYGGMAALIGDAAHAIVPFHGQGMNCCFEDCVEFDACLGRHSSWDARVRGIRRAAQAQHRCDRRDGARQLSGDARTRRGPANSSCSRRWRWNSSGASRSASFRATPW